MSTRTQQYISIIFCVLAGIGLAVMMRVNASLGEHIGVLESSFFAHITGAILAVFILNKKINREFFINLKNAPNFTYTAGLFGVCVVLLMNYLVPKLGMAVCVSIMIANSLVFAIIADHFGFFGLPRFAITKKRLLGLAFAFAGVFLVIWG